MTNAHVYAESSIKQRQYHRAKALEMLLKLHHRGEIFTLTKKHYGNFATSKAEEHNSVGLDYALDLLNTKDETLETTIRAALGVVPRTIRQAPSREGRDDQQQPKAKAPEPIEEKPANKSKPEPLLLLPAIVPSSMPDPPFEQEAITPEQKLIRQRLVAAIQLSHQAVQS